MKLPPLLRQSATRAVVAVTGSLGAAVAPVAKLLLLIGTVYLVDCRMSAHVKTRAEIDSCYFQAMSIMGVGGGVQVGYNTLNPNLKRPEEK